MYLVKTAEGTYESGGWFDCGWWGGLLLITMASLIAGSESITCRPTFPTLSAIPIATV